MEEARRQTDLAPADPFWPYRLAELYCAADSVSRAESALLASLARDRFFAPALSLLSKLYFEGGRHAEAVEMLEAARASHEAFPGGMPAELLEGLALHYDALDRVDLAAGVLAGVPRSSSRRTESPFVYLTLRGEAPDSAATLAAAALKTDPKSAVNQNNYGITRLRAGDLEAARQAFLAAVELDPRLPGPYYNLAILEKYYRFDDEAGARWFRLYGERSTLDPDGLLEVFGGPGSPGPSAKEE